MYPPELVEHRLDFEDLGIFEISQTIAIVRPAKSVSNRRTTQGNQGMDHLNGRPLLTNELVDKRISDSLMQIQPR
jgi:hypothetical protein